MAESMPGPKMVGMSAKRVKTRLFPQTFGCTFQPAPRHGGGARCPGVSCRGGVRGGDAGSGSAAQFPGRARAGAPARIRIRTKERLGALSQSLFCILFPCVASVLPEDGPGATAVCPRCYGGTSPGATAVLVPVLRRHAPHAAGVRSHGRLTSRLTRTALRLDAMPVWIV